MGFKQLHDKALELVSKFRTAEKELIEILQQIEEQEAFRALGYSSLYQYAIQSLKLSEHHAYSLITVSRKSRQVPELKRAIDEGRITTNQARRIASVVTVENQQDWIEKAASLTQRELEKEIVSVSPKEAIKERVSYTRSDRVKLVCGISEKLMKDLERIKDLDKISSIEDVLEKVISFYLEKKDPIQKSQKALARPKVLGTGTVVKRQIPARIKHEVMARDKGQCMQKLPSGKLCGQSRWTQVHHIQPFSVGGSHELSNLITLCHFHHKNFHVAVRT